MKTDNNQDKKIKIQIKLTEGDFEIKIETNSLYLLSYHDDEFEKCVSLYGDPVVTRFFDHGKPRSRQEVQDYINEKNNRYLKNGQPFGIFSIYDKSSMEFIGQVDLAPTEEPGILEIGCILFKQHQDRGIGTEAVKALIFDYVEELNHRGFKCNGIPITKIMGTVHPQNYLSRSLIKKIGMRFDKYQERFGQSRLWYSLLVAKEKNNSVLPIFSHTIFQRPNEYHLNSSIQSEAATQLLEIFCFKGGERVLDIGCGDGKITSNIAGRLKMGSVLGIDISEEMINFANATFPKSSFPNLTFFRQDARQLGYDNEFDVIFSSFALQWILDLDSFLQRVRIGLKPQGFFVATIPMGISSALELSIKEVMSRPDFSYNFYRFNQNWLFPSEEGFKQLLSTNKLDVIHLSAVLHKKNFLSRVSFEKYVLQWFPYLSPLPENLRCSFFKQVIDRYLEIEPPLSNDEVIFKFFRLDAIASKTVF